MKRKISLLLGSVIAFSTIASAQTASSDTLSLSVDECVAIALDENPSIKIADMEITRVDYSKRETIGQLLPNIAFSAAYSRTLAKQTMYMVCFDSDLNALYFSEELNKTILGTGATKYAFSANSSVEAAMADMSGFDKSYGGWVSTAAVPEPTSGLLMLLGMAGLALRRRRA